MYVYTFTPANVMFNYTCLYTTITIYIHVIHVCHVHFDMYVMVLV